MNTEQLRQMIKEEILSALKDRQSTSEPETNIVAESWNGIKSKILAERVKRVRPGVGKKFKSKSAGKEGGSKYTSAGTIGSPQGNSFSTAGKREPKKGPKFQEREKIGDYYLNRLRRGGPEGDAFRQRIKDRLESAGLPTDIDHQYSRIWADASVVASTGGTLSSVKSKEKKSKAKKKEKEKKAKQNSGDNA